MLAEAAEQPLEDPLTPEWKVESRSFLVDHRPSAAEEALVDTDHRMLVEAQPPTA
ncbi:MAG: hypothetical protein ACRDY7_14805 [Acidimicrobiia bacterium]